MVKQSKHDATDAAAGFYFQAMYGLVVLLEAADGHAVSIETADDIEKSGPTPQLVQLKHSLINPPSLTEKNDGLWNTFSIWIPQLVTPELTFVFVTCAEIPDGHKLRALAVRDGCREEVLVLLEAEARRVVTAVGEVDAKKAGKNAANGVVRYGRRFEGCHAFLALSPDRRRDFLNRIIILHRNFNLAAVEGAVASKLTTIPRGARDRIARKLLEWWDGRVARSLAGVDSRTIERDELLCRLHAITVELGDENLTDDYSLKAPEDLSGLLGSNMERQIHLVGGGSSRVQRAALARWRARSQREKWLTETVGIGEDLRRFDRYLIDYWQGRHGPLRDDCANATEGVKRQRGLELLDWAHHEAPKIVPPPRPRWVADFLTQGSYQQLAEEVRVGWHPDYSSLLTENEAAKPTASNRRTRATSRRRSLGRLSKGRVEE